MLLKQYKVFLFEVMIIYHEYAEHPWKQRLKLNKNTSDYFIGKLDKLNSIQIIYVRSNKSKKEVQHLYEMDCLSNNQS